MKKILFITDSLGLPRMKPEAVLAEEAWPYLLSSQLLASSSGKYLFYYHCLHGLTTDNVVEHLQDILDAHAPDVVIIQVGIVDCYPRALTRAELSILSRVPLINKFLRRQINKHYSQLVNIRNISYVDINKFEENNYRIFDYYKNTKIVVIPIAPPSKLFAAKNPRVIDNVAKYNAVLQKVYGDCFLAEMFECPPSTKLFLSDHYHLSVAGNRLIVDKLLEKYFFWCRCA